MENHRKNTLSNRLLSKEEIEIPDMDYAEVASDTEPSTHRILDRDGHFEQSLGRWNVSRTKLPTSTFWFYVFNDPFHTILHTGTVKMIFILLSTYVVAIAVFGGLYVAVDEECKMDIDTYQKGFYFSLETMVTIGYGAQGGDVFFNECWSPLFIILGQSLMGIVLDSLIIGILFARISRGQSRANTVIFSHKACIRRIRGHLYLMFQICEMRKHQLVEAHVRCYTVRHDDAGGGEMAYFQTYPMRLQHPDDDLGAMLLMTLPSVVVHRLDAWSPLLPRGQEEVPHCGMRHQPSVDYLFPEPLQRAVDAESGNREQTKEPSTTPNGTRIPDHDEPIYNCPADCISHHDCVSNQAMHANQLDTLARFWRDTELEVVVLVEGIDAGTSATMQARHSYTSDDILIDHTFVNCVGRNAQGKAVIDFRQFHQTVPVDFACVNVRGSFY